MAPDPHPVAVDVESGRRPDASATLAAATAANDERLRALAFICSAAATPLTTSCRRSTSRPTAD